MFKQVTERAWEIDTRDLLYLYLSYDCDLWKYQKRLVFLLHLALFWLVGLSKRKIVEPSLNCFYRIFFCSRVYMHILGMRLTVIAKANYSWEKQITPDKNKSTQNAIFL